MVDAKEDDLPAAQPTLCQQTCGMTLCQFAAAVLLAISHDDDCGLLGIVRLGLENDPPDSIVQCRAATRISIFLVIGAKIGGAMSRRTISYPSSNTAIVILVSTLFLAKVRT